MIIMLWKYTIFNKAQIQKQKHKRLEVKYHGYVKCSMDAIADLS